MPSLLRSVALALPLFALLALPAAAGSGKAKGTASDAPRPAPTRVNVADPCPKNCITFGVNVHDVNHVGDSADTVSKLIDIFSKYKVKGDFYLTGPMVELYLEKRPDVISKLKSSGMTVSYHVRPPHPLYEGFDSKLEGLSDDELESTLRDYETYRLNRRTGELDRGESGGYTLVKNTFGTAPVTVVAPNATPAIRQAALRVYKGLGAGAVVWYHEEKADAEHPIELRQGLVVRPSDIGLTRWEDNGGKEQFWWNRVWKNEAFNPTKRLKSQLNGWSGGRGAFVTALVHENNFYREGPEGWTLSYYTDKSKSTPLPPPWDLTPEEVSTERSAAEQAAIWQAYEEMVAWSAEHIRVVTGTDFVSMAK